MGRRGATVAVFSVVLLVSGCAGGAGPDGITGEKGQVCNELLRQIAYEAMASLATAGLANDPEGLREALPGGVADGSDITLPDFEEFSSWDSGDQATLYSALQSERTGVGELLDVDAIATSMNATGPCEGWLHE